MLVSNDYELAMILRTTCLDRAELLERTGTIVNTLGELGSRVYTSECAIEIPPAKPEVVVDPTGAGRRLQGRVDQGVDPRQRHCNVRQDGECMRLFCYRALWNARIPL